MRVGTLWIAGMLLGIWIPVRDASAQNDTCIKLHEEYKRLEFSLKVYTMAEDRAELMKKQAALQLPLAECRKQELAQVTACRAAATKATAGIDGRLAKAYCLSEEARAGCSDTDAKLWMSCVQEVEQHDEDLKFSGPVHPCGSEAVNADRGQYARQAWIECRKKFMQRLDAESRREREAAESEAREEAAMEPIRSNPKVVQLVISAEMCREQKARAGALAEINKQKKYSRIGGVVVLKRIADLQDELRDADERIAVQKKRLKEGKFSPLACASAPVQGLLKCADESEQSLPANECSSLMVGRLLKLLSAEHENASTSE